MTRMTHWPNPNDPDQDELPLPSPRQLASLIPRTQESAGHRDDVDCPHCVVQRTRDDHASIRRALRARRDRQEGTSTP